MLMHSICFLQITSKNLLGNSWNLNLQYTKSVSKEFSINVGRTHGVYAAGCVGFFVRTASYGVGYGKLFQKDQSIDVYKLYGDLGVFTSFPLINPVFRLEYNHISQFKTDFLKPEIGLHFVFFDVTYSHAFQLNKLELANPIRHGLNFRIRLYNIGNWKDQSPRRKMLPYEEGKNKFYESK